MLQVDDFGTPRHTPFGSIEIRYQMDEVHMFLARLCANSLGLILSFIIKSFEKNSGIFSFGTSIASHYAIHVCLLRRARLDPPTC